MSLVALLYSYFSLIKFPQFIADQKRIVKATVHQGFSHRLPYYQVTNYLNLPAVGKHQRARQASTLHMVLQLFEDMWVHAFNRIKN